MGWSGTGRWLAHLLLVLFALRAIAPAGYMPDPAALQDGRFEIVVCTPAGLKTIMAAPDRAGPTDDERSSDDLSATECPFQRVMAKALVVPGQDGAPVRWTQPAIPGEMWGRTVMPRSAPPGPPLGPRAPPPFTL